MSAKARKFILVITIISAAVLLPRHAAAHCDTPDGPVVMAAKLALKTGDVTPVLKWVQPRDEAEIRSAFARTMKVRGLGPEAQDLADMHFFETLVRIHRAGEGEPYTGLKQAGTEVEPGIALADKALETGSADALIKQVTTEVANNIQRRFAAAHAASKHADNSTEAGRSYVAAYVEFIHYVERLHQTVSGVPAHAGHEVQTAVTETHQH